MGTKQERTRAAAVVREVALALGASGIALADVPAIEPVVEDGAFSWPIVIAVGAMAGAAVVAIYWWTRRKK